jgi:hypothetical protein
MGGGLVTPNRAYISLLCFSGSITKCTDDP